jgi:hypothetical protein
MRPFSPTQHHQRQRQHDADDGEGEIQHPLHDARRARGAESVREDQPARLQVVDQDFPREPLVRRRRILDADARHLRTQQLFDRQVPAPIR